ncbi:MAG: polysaccharide deacetylase family protein [Cyclobacteriaceae bacterium]|nr:polysaccharide deacetylase family protein [Cyclobacteriaceae bacterium]
MKKNVALLFALSLFFASCTRRPDAGVGQTEITKWPGNRQAGISITYDDGTINQFTVARPIMNELGLPGTFYIITGKVPGSGKGQFLGRPTQEIVDETASLPTQSDNFFERASLIAYTGIPGAEAFHARAGSLFESGRYAEAYQLMDQAFELVRKGETISGPEYAEHVNPEDTTTWEDYRTYAAEGHEIASHTVTHARLAVLDEPNLRYELEQSKADIRKYLGEKYTFSAECPYGTENERVMDYAHEVYPSLRNRMPEPYLDELNRASKRNPGETDREYVQWQRGPLTNIGMDMMKTWVDTCLVHDNVWLVLVFHGVEGIGWEPRTGPELREYFTYIKERESRLWVATFADVTRYIRQRKGAVVTSTREGDDIHVTITQTLDTAIYNLPLTAKTYVPADWTSVILRIGPDGTDLQTLPVQQDANGSYVLYDITAGQGSRVLRAG